MTLIGLSLIATFYFGMKVEEYFAQRDLRIICAAYEERLRQLGKKCKRLENEAIRT